MFKHCILSAINVYSMREIGNYEAEFSCKPNILFGSSSTVQLSDCCMKMVFSVINIY